MTAQEKHQVLKEYCESSRGSGRPPLPLGKFSKFNAFAF